MIDGNGILFWKEQVLTMEKEVEQLKIENGRLCELIDEIIGCAEEQNVEIRFVEDGKTFKITKKNMSKD